MIWRIARKEVTEMVRDGRFRLAAGIVFALLVASLVVGWRQYRTVHDQHAAAQRATREHWLTQGKKNPHSAAHYGVYAFQPKLPLSLVDQGADAYTGVAIWLEAHKQNQFQYRPAADANTLQRFGELTAATVLQVLIPLLIVLMTFAAFAGERELGTLRQLLSLGVSRRDLALGKAGGVALGLSLLLVPAAVLGGFALTLAAEPAALAASVPRALLVAAAYLLYFAAFVGLSIAVSAHVRTARLALITLLAFWITNCLVAPRALADLAKALHPTPSAFQFAEAVEHDLKHGADGHSPSAIRAEAYKRSVLKLYGVASVDKLPVSYAGLSLQHGEDEGNDVYDQHYGELWDAYEAQNRVRQSGGLLAPLLAVRSVSMGLAGTDFEQYRHFATAAEQYRRDFIRVINTDIARNAVKASGPYLRAADLWSQVPAFRYEEPGLAWVLARQRISLALLLAWALAAGLLAYWSVARLEVD